MAKRSVSVERPCQALRGVRRRAAWRGAAVLAAILAGAAPRAGVDFQREVRPILSEHCFKCHGPDDKARKAHLRLDTRAGAVGKPDADWRAVVPGQPDQSPLIKRITSDDPDELMPPPKINHPLSAAQRETLRQWIADGAEYTRHWAFVAPQKPELPPVQRSDWARNPIDRFTLARMEARGLEPSPEADKYTLIRRLSLDLIGLPPTPEAADAFVADTSPDAYERLVDRLLASPHYGERWARRWMDLARYADSNGYEKDRERSIWPWRDWVIRAFNAGMPFDRFTVEQLAGDMLPHATLEQRVATGFNRNSMINEEGGTDPQEFRFYAMVDRVHVTATTWMGLTMQCAQCHSHKYDPISQTDYYRFMGLLNNADELQMDVPQPDLVERRTRQQAEIDRRRATLLNEFPPELRADWITPARVALRSEAGAEAERLPDGSWRMLGEPADQDTYVAELDSDLGRVTHLQLQTLPDPELAHNGPGRSEGGNFVLSEIEVSVAPRDGSAPPKPVKLARARADFAQKDFPPWKAIDGKTDKGWAIQGDGDWHVARTLTLEFAEPVELPAGAKFTVRLIQDFGKQHLIGRLRLALGSELADRRPLDLRRREHLDYRLARWLDAEMPRVTRWEPLAPRRLEANLPTLTVEDENVVFVSGDYTKRDVYRVDFDGSWKGVTALRVEVLPDPRLPNRGPGRVAYEGPFGNFFLSDLQILRGTNALPIAAATDSFHEKDNTAAQASDDNPLTGWSINGGQGRAHNAVFRFKKPLDFDGALRLRMVFEKYYAAGLGKFRVWVTRDQGAVASALPNDVREALLTLRDGPSETRRWRLMERLREYFVTVAPELAQERDEIARLERKLPRYPTTLVFAERPAGHTRPTHRHERGDFLRPKEEVRPGVPGFLPDLPKDAPRNRLGLARWLVSRDNPLTARVIMNRQWQAFFGRGLVRTLGDFGFQGDPPTHPQLLDWLAVEFMDRDWSLKAMQKLIVMSATYRQSSRVTPERLEQDAENLYLARGPRFRLEAELVRDNALAASGLLSEKQGGPSVFPPQLASITTEGAYRPFTWRTSQGEDRYRRSIYTFAKRTAPFAAYAAFDAPSGEECVPLRERSNSPLQALTLLNDTLFLEFARALGDRVAGQDGPIEARARALFRRCLVRPPTAAELDRLVAFYRKQLERFRTGDLDPAKLLGADQGEHRPERAAWTALARVLLNLDETITKS